MDEDKNAKKTSKSEFAIASLVLGIIPFLNIFGFEKAIAAVVFGILALKRIKKDSSLAGKGLAIAGIALGVLFMVIIIILVIAFYPSWAHIKDQLQAIQFRQQ